MVTEHVLEVLLDLRVGAHRAGEAHVAGLDVRLDVTEPRLGEVFPQVGHLVDPAAHVDGPQQRDVRRHAGYPSIPGLPSRGMATPVDPSHRSRHAGKIARYGTGRGGG